MAIRFVNRGVRRAFLQSALDDAQGVIVGSNGQPASRSGVIGAQLAGASALIQGLKAASQNRTGVLGTALGALSPSLSGHVTAPVGTGSVPDKAINVLLLSDGTPGTAYSICPHAAANGSQVTQVEGLLTPSGITGIQPRHTLSNSPINAQSCRVDYFNVPPGAQTAQMRFVNANGPGPYSDPSNSVTPVAYTDTWPIDGHRAHFPFCGGSQIGINRALWNLGYFDFQLPVRTVDPGTSTSTHPNFNPAFNPTVNAPPYPVGANMTNQQLLEVLPDSANGYGFLCGIFLQNGPGGNNGIFNANPYLRLCFYFYPTVAGSYASGTETTINTEGTVNLVTASGSSVIHEYDNQDFAVNTWAPVAGSVGIFNRTIGNATGFLSNIANAITSQSITIHSGDRLLTQIGDQATGRQVNVATYVKGPTPGVITLNQWNRAEIPLDATGYDMLVDNFGMHYKSGIAMPPGVGATWVCNYAFVQQ